MEVHMNWKSQNLIKAHLAVGVLRDPTVNAALRNLSGDKSSEKEKKDKATHSQKGKFTLTGQ